MPDIGKVFDTYRDTYSKTVNDALGFSGLDVDFFTKVKIEYIADIVSSKFHGRTDISALDVGCGIGNYHKGFSRIFGDLTGIDLSRESIEVARSHHPEFQYVVYNGGRIPFSDARFDVATAICVMHHVPPQDWTGFTSEMHRILKPGGLALVFEHNPKNPLTMRVVNRCPFDEDAVLLRPSETVDLFQKAGFEKVEWRSVLTLPAAGRGLRRLDKMFGRLPFGAQYYVSAMKGQCR